jgi:hypothetical protein
MGGMSDWRRARQRADWRDVLVVLNRNETYKGQ